MTEENPTAPRPTASMYPDGECPNCGGRLHGDGYGTVLHCELAEEDAYRFSEPDVTPVFCKSDDQVNPPRG